MFSHLKVIALATAGLASLAVLHSWAAPVVHGQTRMTAPPQLQVQLQVAQVRHATAASMRAMSGY